jgi:PAS domain S-box-containing protein
MPTEPRMEAAHARPDPAALFGALFAQSPVGIAVFSVESRFLQANPALCRLLGYTEPELRHKTHADLVHPDDRESAAAMRASALSGKSRPRLAERRYVRKDGSTLLAHVAGAIVRDPAGTPLCSMALISDITALKRTAKSSEERFFRMVELSSDWYWMQDANFRFVEVPELQLPDFEIDVVVGKARWEISGLSPMHETWEQHRARLERHESFSNLVLLRQDRFGGVRYLDISGEPLFDERGALRGYHGIGKDITDRVRELKLLADSEERYRMLFEVHPQPMWVLDADTLKFLAVNGAAVGLYGYSREEFLGMTAHQLRLHEEVGELLKAFEDQSTSYRQRIWRHRKRNGESIQVKIVSFNLEFDARPARLAVVYDLTDELRVEQQLRELEARYEALLEEKDPKRPA